MYEPEIILNSKKLNWLQIINRIVIIRNTDLSSNYPDIEIKTVSMLLWCYQKE